MARVDTGPVDTDKSIHLNPVYSGNGTGTRSKATKYPSRGTFGYHLWSTCTPAFNNGILAEAFR
eukprot:scaffold948_cov106-Cylindrotheca_fusiformis.AAC.5